ncbi:hypothetical protein B9Z45_02140 [Limnohabitans sp. 2KL-17]|uniref:hypothetical protein n=1 Tax=Limnohabitans sp. 2KL-17 TaxID=1100704 RepID=UPI000D33F31D|nr:hypothetical protein [Limnohabitans sp. 2KL-17]PUE62887.1 hypothetical protein B9Z45_02140 [Limnohabitans sp. 2KL-17]
MIIVSQIISPIFFVIKDIFVTQTIQLEGQKPSKPISCNQLMGFGFAEIKTLPNGVKFIFFTVGGIPFTAPATSANISALSKFIPVYELEFDDDCNMKKTEVSESIENTIARKIARTRAAHEIEEAYKNPKPE